MTEVQNERPFYIGFADEDPYERNPEDITFQLLVPSLEHMAKVKLALELWTEKWAERDSSRFYESVIDCVRNEVLDDISMLNLPILLKEKLSGGVVQVVKEVKDFIHFFRRPEENDLISRLDVKSIIWTSRGQIDYIKTTEIIRNCNHIVQEVRDITSYGSKYGFDFLSGWESLTEDRFTSLLNRLCSYNYRSDNTNRASWTELHLLVSCNMYHICDETIGEGIYLTKNVWADQYHPIMQTYFDCTSDERRKGFIYAWTMFMRKNPQHDACFLFAKLTGKMLKLVITQLMNYFFYTSFQEDYFFQTITLVHKTMPHFDFKQCAISVAKCLNDLKDMPLAFNNYTIFYDKFCSFLSQNLTDDNKMSYYYLLLNRKSLDFDEMKSILSHLNERQKYEILLLDECSICRLVLRETGLDLLKMLVENCCENEDHMRSVAYRLAKNGQIVNHYYDRNDFNGFSSFHKWITITSRRSQKSISVSYLLSFIRKDIDRFIACYQEGRYPVADDVYRTADAILNWIWRSDAEKIASVKRRYMRRDPILPHISLRCEPGEYCVEFNHRMIAWIFNNDEEKIQQYKTGSKYANYHNSMKLLLI